MRPSTQRRRAAALVITVGLLAVLAVIGFGFAVLMKIQHTTSNYFQASASVEMLSHGVFAYAIRDIRDGWSTGKDQHDPVTNMPALQPYPTNAKTLSSESPLNPWYSGAGVDFDMNTSTYVGWGCYRDGSGASSRGRYCNVRCNSYALVQDVLGDHVAVSMAKVLDSASKINVNDDHDRLSAILTTLFTELGINTTIDKTTPLLTTSAILASPDHPFDTLDELKGVTGMTARRYEVLKHYLTVYSWPHDPESVSGFIPWIVKPNASQSLTATKYKRWSPININTAPREILVAVLANIKVRSKSALGLTKARDIATWIIRKRDPENKAHWGGTFHSTWSNWLSANDYCGKTTSKAVRKRGVQGWRAYPLGPFDNWNEVVDFVHSLTDTATTVEGGDPFPAGEPSPIDDEDAETILAGINPNTAATLVPRNAYHMAWTRLSRELRTEQFPRDLDDVTTNTKTPQVYGRDDLAATDGYVLPFCFSSMGRFEIFSQTFAFTKADVGKVTNPDNFGFNDNSKHWGTNPAQWRGYSVLIYDGEGKGQLRAIVNSGINWLKVAKWSTPPVQAGNISRYYILGPGPLLDRVGNGIAVDLTNTPHLVEDSGPTGDLEWQDDQWNGYRIVVYRTDAGGSAIYDGTIQERIIINTIHNPTGREKLVLNAELDNRLTQGSRWAYIILGTYGTVAHDAAVKAYDVIHHTSQKDFAPNNSNPAGCYKIAIGPNPIKLSVASAEQDGWVAVETMDETTGSFQLEFNNRWLTPSGGSKHSSTNAAVTDVFEQDGNLLPDGLHLPSGSSKIAAYTTSTALVTDGRTDGVFVGFWFRPDQDCMDGPTRTLLRIQGDTAKGACDIRLLLQGAILKVEIHQDDVLYTTANVPKIGGGTVVAPVKYRKTPRSPFTLNVTNTAGHAAIKSPWRAGEWHHIALAWYECDESGATDDGAGDNFCDQTPINPGEDGQLDSQPQVKGWVQVWVDGTEVSAQPVVDAFNITPGAGKPYLILGQSGSAPAGTIDGVIATTGILKGLTNVSLPDINARYYGYNTKAYATYQSPTINLPSEMSGKELCLGTVTWTGWQPRYKDADKWYQHFTDYPIRVRVTLTDRGTSTSMPDNWQQNQAVNGGGDALRTGPGTNRHTRPMIDGTAASISYKAYLLAYHGDNGTGMPEYWQTPLLDDITITYLGPVTFFHWR